MRKRNYYLLFGVSGLTLIVFLAIISFFWLPYDLSDTSGSRLETFSIKHILGTDRLGRDLLTQIILGARVAVLASFFSVIISLILGVSIGLLAAFSNQWRDDLISSAIDIMIAFPTLLLAMLIVATQGSSIFSVIIAIGIAMAAITARLTRIVVKRILAQNYILAARVSGTKTLGIVLWHILPNLWPTIIVTAAIQVGVAVITESSLSYLGLGAPPPNPSWGALLMQAQSSVMVAPLGAIAPGIMIVITVLSANMLADGLREKFDPVRK